MENCSQEPWQLRIRPDCTILVTSKRLVSAAEGQPNIQQGLGRKESGGRLKGSYLYAAISSAKVGPGFPIPLLLEMTTPSNQSAADLKCH